MTFQRPRYHPKCKDCHEDLDKQEILFNIDICDECLVDRLARANRQRLARKLGKDPAQLEEGHLPEFDPERHR